MTELHFKGKDFVYNHHLAVPFRPLEPVEKKGIGPAALDGNLIVHGDNLHALKALLPLYAGKVDCVFIDPPYNTGNENWCYSDNVSAPMIKEWLASNPVGIDDGLRHDKWCAMMWPRLRMLHELMAEDGSLWMTLDDNENHRGKLMLDEIFGEPNFLGTIGWESKTKSQNTEDAFNKLQPKIESILAYTKRDKRRFNLISAGEKDYPESDDSGPYRVASMEYMSAAGIRGRDTMVFSIRGVTLPKGKQWQLGEDTIKKYDKRGDLFVKKGKPFIRMRPFDERTEKTEPFWGFFPKDIGTTESAKKELNALMGGKKHGFETVKPVEMIKRLMFHATGKNSIVLDSFAGSGTTAHAVLEANKRDGGNRQFILVEMEDYADKLTAERVRRVIKGYKFKGKQKTELLRENISWAVFKKADRLAEQVESIENLHGHEYDCIKKEIKDSTLIVTGEKTVEKKAEGLGGEFTYCMLGEAVELEKLLSGKNLPSYLALGSLLFNMAANRALDGRAMREKDFYLGEANGQHVWMIYKPDLEWLKSSDAAMTLARARQFAATDAKKPHLVIAAARYVSQKLLNEENLPVEFVALPYALYRIDRS